MKKSSRRERAAAQRAKSAEKETGEESEMPQPHPRRSRRASSGNGPLVRNLVIIAGLILVIAFTWKEYQRALAAREAERETIVQSTATPPVVPAPLETPVEIPVEDPGEDPVARIESAEVPEPVAPPAPEPLPEPPPEPPAPPEPLSPAQSLIRLRADLAAGKRDAMPVGTIRRGDADFFLVNTPMTWSQANGFADAYGGHLPLPADPEDLAWLASQVADAADPARSSLWVGARRHGENWYSLDGSPLESVPGGDGAFAAVTADGTLQASGDEQRYRFFIEWQRDGSNPASLRAVLARTKASLGSPAPSYPPGTLSDGERHLLIVSRAINSADASELAALAGGHLMVPATPAEADWIAREVAGNAFPKGLWLGAAQSDDEWRWTTGEAWTFARWDPAAPGEGTALLILPGGTWQSADPAAEASGLLIEWSRDTTAPAVPALSESPADLLGKANDLLAAARQQRQADLADNSRTLSWSLDAWLRTNNKSEIAKWKPRIEALKARVSASRVPGDLPKKPNDEFSERMLKVARGCFEKQQSIDAAYFAKAGRIRDAHVARLLELAAAEEKRGQPALARQRRATAAAAADLKAWFATLDSPPAE